MKNVSLTPDVLRAIEEEYPPGEMHSARRARFLAKVDVVANGESCWTWHGWRHAGGYGLMRVTRSPRVDVMAHRVSWEMANNAIVPAGLGILHRCDNPPCVRPSHLRPGTQADNMADAIERDRRRPRTGENNGRHLLTDDAVREILRQLATGQRPCDIARDRGVASETILGIATGRKWRHIDRSGLVIPRGRRPSTTTAERSIA